MMFFLTDEQIPAGVGFPAFGLVHILWLLAGGLLCAGACLLYRRLPADKRKTMLIGIGVCIFLLEVVKDLVLLLCGQIQWKHLPLHLCGVNILLIAFDVVKQTKTVRGF